MLNREQGDMEAATQHLLRSKELGELAALPGWQYRWCLAQARIKEDQGDLDAALTLLCDAEHLDFASYMPDIRPLAALKARVWLRQGKLTKSLDWVCERNLSVNDDLSFMQEFEHITLARILIAEYKFSPSERCIVEATGLLERLEMAAEKGGRMGSLIEILVLQALAHEAQDDVPSALTPLARALSLAEPEGYVRIFVDEGIEMTRLLSEAAAQKIMPDYVSRLRAVYATKKQKSEDKPSISPDSSAQSLIEQLSKRELEVLRLIAQGCTNREIGERLFVALDTVKGHNRNIFGKLQVKRRTEAVARARELGLL
jgi:LuxR family maltose regulon positive regulatory protein